MSELHPCYSHKMAQILDGKAVRKEAAQSLKREVESISETLRLAIIQVGSREDSNSYIRAKKKFGTEIGVDVQHVIFPEKTTTAEILLEIQKLNSDLSVHGVIVQLPMPPAIDKDVLLNAIHPHKDVDGLGALNVQKILEGREDAIMPATTRGILSLLKFYEIQLEGKKVVVVGRSSLVGKPTALACLAENATVTVCHSKTEDLPRVTKTADVLIVAIGRPNYIKKEYVGPNQTVIDVGINSLDYGKLDDEILLPSLVGDVDYNEVKDIVKAITPVPGGVGQMTVVSLFQNVVDVYKRYRSIDEFKL